MRKKKVLIVDDEKHQLVLLEALLINLGFQNIIKFESGREALRLANVHKPDLFIIDIMMPEMTGGELRELLKDNPATKDIPVIFLSGIISKKEEIKLGGIVFRHTWASGEDISAENYRKKYWGLGRVSSTDEIFKGVVEVQGRKSHIKWLRIPDQPVE